MVFVWMSGKKNVSRCRLILLVAYLLHYCESDFALWILIQIQLERPLGLGDELIRF